MKNLTDSLVRMPNEQVYDEVAAFLAGGVSTTKDGRVLCTRRQAKAIIVQVMESLFTELVQKGRGSLPGGLGSFYLLKLSACKHRFPGRGSVEVPSRYVVRFDAGNELKKRLPVPEA